MNIEFIKQIKRKENLSHLRKEINEKWVNTKIENHLKRNPHLKETIQDIKNKILVDDLIGSFFIKEPGRQNISENIVAEQISKIKDINNFINLSSSVNLFVIDGKITNIRIDGIKSIDFTWNYKGKKVFAAQKYTNEFGGAQDNQYNDVINFLKNCQKNENHIFIAIVDGKYYNKTKMNNLKKYEKDNVKVCSINDLEEVLHQIN